MALLAAASGSITLNYRISSEKGGSKHEEGALESSAMGLSLKMGISDEAVVF